jgi:hypothetical protein
MEAIFDRHGDVVGWLERQVVYTTTGCPRAVIRGGAVCSYTPVHLGWFANGYFRDLEGGVVAWMRGAHGGPPAPPARLPDACPFPQFATLPPLPPLSPVRPLPVATRSALTWHEYLGRDALRPPAATGRPLTLADLAPLIAGGRREWLAAAPPAHQPAGLPG